MSNALAPSPPPRHAICLDCRTALVEGEPCDAGPRHRVVSLRTPEGKKRLLDEVWGPANLRRNAKRIVRAGAGGTAGGSFVSGCGDCGVADCSGAGDLGEAAVILVVLAVAAFAAVILVWAIMKLVRYIQSRRDTMKPFGALARAAAIDALTPGGLLGVAQPSHAGAAPGAFLAYLREYRARSVLGGDVMLRDAASYGFDVRLDDGRVVHVPAGRVRIEGATERLRGADYERAERDAANVLPGWTETKASADRTSDPFPFDDARELLVLPGDAVKICSRVDVDAYGVLPSYRGGEARLVAGGVPALRVLPRRTG